MPLSFVVLVWVFGGLLAAALPIAVGVFAILGSMAALRTISLFTDVSIFALNLTVAMGLALAIDYTLLILSRFRDELAEGADRGEALIRTMATAGRTVLFSAMTVALSMVTMVLFPQYFLKSFGYAGVAVVAFAAAAAIVVTPAAIVLLGERLDSLDVRRLLRHLLGRRDPTPRPVEHTFWFRWTKFVMRHALPIGAAIIALLLVLGAPFLGVDGVSPTIVCCPTRHPRARLAMSCAPTSPSTPSTNINVVLPHASGVTPADLTRYAAELSTRTRRVVGVRTAAAPSSTARRPDLPPRRPISRMAARS